MVKQKVVVRISSLDNAKKRTKALQTAVTLHGITSVSLDRDRLTVVCDGTDVIDLMKLLRKKLGHADLISVSSGDEKLIKEDKESKLSSSSKSVSAYEYGYPYPYPYAYQGNIYR